MNNLNMEDEESIIITIAEALDEAQLELEAHEIDRED